MGERKDILHTSITVVLPFPLQFLRQRVCSPRPQKINRDKEYKFIDWMDYTNRVF